MLIVPLLVGIAILTVAIMSRVEAKERRPADRPSTEADVFGLGNANHPLRKAFPHLRIWIPSDELLGRDPAANGRMIASALPGAIGPDVIVGPWPGTPKRQDDSYADAA